MNKLGGVPGEILEEGGSFVKTAASQIAGGKNKPVADAAVANKKAEEEIVKKMYEPSSPAPAPAQSQESLNEEKEKAELRQKLHDETYYNPTFNPPKKQEERPVEKVEREKQEEMQELQKKEEEKTPPLAVQRAANKTERFPGTSG